MKDLIIKEIHFANFNGQDNLRFTIEGTVSDILAEKPVYENCKVFQEELNVRLTDRQLKSGKATLWVKIYECGIANFGYTVECDPLHHNERYTWSSNAGAINDAFNLVGTPYELARYGAGIADSKYEYCYWAGQLTKALALKLGEENTDKLHWGLDAWKQTIDTSVPYFDGGDK